MNKPVLAILTESIRFDNQEALKYFSKIKVVHFYKNAPYRDLRKADLRGAIKYYNFKDLEQKIEILKPNIIQGAEPYGSKEQLKLCYLAWKISKRLKIPLIFPMLENRPVKSRFGSSFGLIIRNILKRYANQAKLIFYLNEGAKRNLLEVDIQPRKMIKMLYGIWGVDCAVFRPINQKSKIKNQKVLFVGRLEEAKGIPYILNAWKKIAPKFPETELIFVGEGNLSSQIKGLRIKKWGQVKTKDLPKIFNQASLTLYPSVTLKRWEEQVGMVNLQSLACGVPVVTTRSGAIPEYVNDKVGILVPERDSNALAQAMEKLLKNNSLREKLGQNGRKYVLENFDAQKTVEKVELILLNLLK